MNKILVPTDFSKHSNYALEYASFIAREKESKLIITHVISSNAQIDDVKKCFDEIKNCSYLIGISYEFRIEVGSSVSKAINKVAEEFKIDLIIIGSNGISNIEEMILGSNTENVIRNSQFNVLTIKHKMSDLKIDSILFPSDFSSEVYTVFEAVKKLAAFFEAKIHLLKVNTSSKDEDNLIDNKKIDGLIEYYQLKEEEYEKMIYNGKTEELGIINYCIDYDIDLIVIGSHGKGVLMKLIKESTSQNLVRDSYRPVLTMKFS